MKRIVRWSGGLLAAAAGTALAVSNIDDSVPNKVGWMESAGWTNWRDANGAADGVSVGPFVMSGFVWGENIGWINVGDGAPASPPFYANTGADDFGVNIDSTGHLHGLAWAENAGWLNVDGGAPATEPARLLCDGRLAGYAWSENLGWMNLSVVTAGQFVALEAAAVPVPCDADRDGRVDGLDIQAFVWLLTEGGAGWAEVCLGDREQPPDGQIDADDVAPFVACLLTG